MLDPQMTKYMDEMRMQQGPRSAMPQRSAPPDSTMAQRYMDSMDDLRNLDMYMQAPRDRGGQTPPYAPQAPQPSNYYQPMPNQMSGQQGNAALRGLLDDMRQQ